MGIPCLGNQAFSFVPVWFKMNRLFMMQREEAGLTKKILFSFILVLPLFALQLSSSNWYKLTGGKDLTLPETFEYRKWQFAGSSVIPDDRNNNKALFPGTHHVYIDPDAYKHRQEKGFFPDGTIIVMEVSHLRFTESEAGHGYFTTGGYDILVQIKDRRVFSGKGWSYYAFYDKDLKAGKKIAAPADGRCQSCHQAGGEDDEVFSQYYPTLRKP